MKMKADVFPSGARRALLLAALLSFAAPGVAKNAASTRGATAFPAPSAGLKLLLAGDNDLAELRALTAASNVQAVSLEVSLATLRRDPLAAAALGKWVRDGGTVFLHTDAAQLFGYLTTPARLTTNARAGQLYGRARAAVPFGASPLLWNTHRQTIRGGASLKSAFSAPTVGTVFYEMQPGDDLVISHPAAVPLLRVDDVTGNDDAPLYAAAIAPYGRGWTIFTPRRIEQSRADGGAFTQNLVRFAAAPKLPALEAAPAATTPGTATPDAAAPATTAPAAAPGTTAPNAAPLGTTPAAATPAASAPVAAAPAADASEKDAAPALRPAFVSLPAAVLEELSTQAAQENFDAAGWFSSLMILARDPNATVTDETQTATGTVATSVATVGAAVTGDAKPAARSALYAENDPAPYAPGLMIESHQLEGLLRLLSASSTGNAEASTRARALIFVWRARLEVQHDNGAAARAWADQSAGLAPAASETLLWQGTVTYNEAAALGNTADRATGFQKAAALWRAAPAAPPLSGVPSAARTLAIAWASGAEQAVRLAQATPDFASNGAPALAFYSDGNPDTVRAFSGLAANLSALTGAFGWRPDDLSLIAFPDFREYSRFRQAVGLPAQTTAFRAPLPDYDTGQFGDEVSATNAGGRTIFPRNAVGDVIGASMLTVVTPPATGNVSRAIRSNGVVTELPASSLIPPSQLLVRALLNTLFQDGAPPPRWMELGLQTLADRSESGPDVTFEIPALGTNNGVPQARTLRQEWRANRLLAPQRFDDAAVLSGASGVVAVAQSRSLMRYFYRRYGAGRVVETLQRIAAGQTPDAALNATIGLNQAQFFQAWSRAAFGQRR